MEQTYQRTILQQVFTWLSFLVLTALALFLAVNYQALPKIVPMHFNFAGEIDGYAGRASVWLLPIIGFLMWLLLFVIGAHPEKHNYMFLTEANKRAQYRLSCTIVAGSNLFISLVFMIITLAILQQNDLKNDPILFTSFLTLIGLGISGIGYMIYRLIGFKRTRTN
ncbi:DUF1648 domain-containing protein [Brochothrix campestris]|uniref:DUF1648 domain-containing protein n=1 Tax=Brochothrix campestris FSL F6-1037 TaxID=1265861 RepID=W7CJG5_9LIST|nr:DUF1648 domain-containing protein [Brochothrix campestris]EUJ37127.1 hypothetical protein BCAMP_10235 [Brochothrix campestris FSL F6-1037]